MADITNTSFACVTTQGSRVIFMITRKADNIMEHIAVTSRAIEQIESDPGPDADLTEHGIAAWSAGTLALEEIQRILLDLTS